MCRGRPTCLPVQMNLTCGNVGLRSEGVKTSGLPVPVVGCSSNSCDSFRSFLYAAGSDFINLLTPSNALSVNLTSYIGHPLEKFVKCLVFTLGMYLALPSLLRRFVKHLEKLLLCHQGFVVLFAYERIQETGNLFQDAYIIGKKSQFVLNVHVQLYRCHFLSN